MENFDFVEFIWKITYEERQEYALESEISVYFVSE